MLTFFFFRALKGKRNSVGKSPEKNSDKKENSCIIADFLSYSLIARRKVRERKKPENLALLRTRASSGTLKPVWLRCIFHSRFRRKALPFMRAHCTTFGCEHATKLWVPVQVENEALPKSLCSLASLCQGLGSVSWCRSCSMTTATRSASM